MTGPLYQFFIDDHRRLEELLNQAVAAPGRIHLSAYDAFRRGLLKHISVEEKVLLPAAQLARDGEILPMAVKLRLDHAALAALLVPPPSEPFWKIIIGLKRRPRVCMIFVNR
ncbi:MAG: hemerythrin domain-containing protein [Nitrospirae bacterium]|nr:hemerythrin domain-containing protein [Candidatus Manganitrophaceae bacterium]